MIDRRSMLQGGAGLGAAGILSASCAAPRAAARSAHDPFQRLVVDALGAFFNPNGSSLGAELSDKQIAAIDRKIIQSARAAGIDVVNYTVGAVVRSDDPYGETKESLDAWDAMLAGHADICMPVRSPADIASARSSGKLGIVYGFQNAIMLGDDPARVGEFAARGVRVFQITYNLQNALGAGAMAGDDMGLTDLGRTMINAMHSADVMIDLSHSSQQTCLDAIETASGPISITHTGCRALTNLPRNKTDEELRGVADKGGFVGIYFMPFIARNGMPTMDDVVRHIEHAVNICGEDHVGIGSDTFTTPIEDFTGFSKQMRALQQHRLDMGIAAAGETLEFLPLVKDLSVPQRFTKLSAALADIGYSSSRIDKILGLNFQSYAQRVWTKG